MPLSPTWTIPTERTEGELITAAIWNTDIGNNLLFLNQGVAARATTAAGQSISNNTETVVNFGTVEFDTDNAITTGAGWRFTAPFNGNYLVSAAIMFASTTTWSDIELGALILRKNGSLYAYLDRKDSYGSASGVLMQLGGTSLVNLNAGEYIDIRVLQNSGAALALFNSSQYNHVNIAKV